MAQKTLQEFSAPSLENIPTGPRFAVEEGAPEFELKSCLINLVQATQFSGKAHEDASAHLQNFLEIGSTIHMPFSILTRRESEEVVLHSSR